MITPSKLESDVLNIVEAVKSGTYIEDSFTELKERWPNNEAEISKTARQLAAHCNSAQGRPVLWIYGINEQTGAIGSPTAELASIWPSIQSRFDGVSPDLLLNQNVPVDDGHVTALLFDVTRAPYVINRARLASDQSNNAVDYEVPWRRGNSTRTANRGELIRLLQPASQIPAIELMQVYAEARETPNSIWYMTFCATIYAVSWARSIVTAHHSKLTFDRMDMVPQQSLPGGFKIAVDQDLGVKGVDIVVDPSALFFLELDGPIGAIGPHYPSLLNGNIELGVFGTESGPRLSFNLIKDARFSNKMRVYYSWAKSM